MNISAPFITRPVATTLLGFAVLLAGVMGFMRLSVSPLPQVDFPTIQVTTQLPGANPDTIASLVTASLERQFGQIPSLSTMSSQSAFGFSQITLQFDLDRDIDAAAQDVQSAINAAASTLPRNLPYPPVYAKVNPADTPIVTLTLRSQTSTLREMSDLADTQLAPRLSEVPGVGRVMVEGGVRPAIRIQADLARLAANHMSMDDLRLAIAGANVAGAKGSIDGARQSYTLDANDQLMLASEYRDHRRPMEQWPSDHIERRGQGGGRARKQPRRRLVQRRAGGRSRRRAPARRQYHQHGRIAERRAAEVAAASSRGHVARYRQRPHRHDQSLHLRCRNHSGDRHRAGRHGGAAVPAQHPRDHHRGHQPAAVDRRDIRDDVGGGILARQSVLDGAHDRHRLRRRRRHRDDREHRPQHREGQDPDAGGAGRRARDRLHRRIAHGVADRRVHSAAVHDRHRRAHVPRIRAHLCRWPSSSRRSCR